MKKIIAATFIVLAATTSIFADYPIANPRNGQYLIAGKQPNEVPVKPAPTTLKQYQTLTPFGRWIYEVELIWLTGHGGWK